MEEKQTKQRTIQQNKSLHLYFVHLAAALNASGLDMRRTLKPGIDISWNADSVKQYLFKPVMNAQLGIESTTELSTKDIDTVYDTLNRHLGEKFSLHVPFPSIEEQLFEQRVKSK